MSGSELPTMLLTTTGRKTGKERSVPLHYVRDGNNLVAVCENFGLDTASSWRTTCAPRSPPLSCSRWPFSPCGQAGGGWTRQSDL